MPSNAKTDPRHDFLPARDVDLVTWSRNFRDFIVADASAFGLTQQQADHYSALHDFFAAKFATTTNPSANSASSIVAKNDAKKALKAEARVLARIIRATPSVTPEQRSDLALTLPDATLTPVARPGEPPELYVLPSLGKTVRIRLKDKSSPNRLGRPLGTAGAVVMTYTAQPGTGEDDPPASMSKWTLCGIATRRYFDVHMDADVPAGAQVWITAMWFNTRGQMSTPSAAQSVRAGNGMAKLRMAA